MTNNLKNRNYDSSISNKIYKVLESVEVQTTEIKKEINRLQSGIDTYNSLTNN